MGNLFFYCRIAVRSELSAPFVIKGAMDGEAFVKYVQEQLAPTLRPDDVVICDNLNVHKNSRAIEAIEARGAWLFYVQLGQGFLRASTMYCGESA